MMNFLSDMPLFQSLEGTMEENEKGVAGLGFEAVWKYEGDISVHIITGFCRQE